MQDLVVVKSLHGGLCAGSPVTIAIITTMSSSHLHGILLYDKIQFPAKNPCGFCQSPLNKITGYIMLSRSNSDMLKYSRDSLIHIVK